MIPPDRFLAGYNSARLGPNLTPTIPATQSRHFGRFHDAAAQSPGYNYERTGRQKMMKFALRVLAAALAIGLAGPAFAADVLHVGKAAQEASPLLPVDVGTKAGIFAKHGLDVQVANFSGGGKLHQAMEAGAIDIGAGAGPELALIAKGAQELAVANHFPPVTFIGIAVPADSTARTIDDLKGKKIGVSTAGSLTYWLAQRSEE